MLIPLRGRNYSPSVIRLCPNQTLPFRCLGALGRVSKDGDGVLKKIQAFVCIDWKHSSRVTCKGPVEENLTHRLFKSSTIPQIWGC